MCFLQKWNPSNCLLVKNLQRQLREEGAREEGAGTKQTFSVSRTRVVGDLGTQKRKIKKKLEKLRPVLSSAKSCQFCSYKLTHSHFYIFLLPLLPSPHLQDQLLWSLPLILGSGLVSGSQLHETHMQGVKTTKAVSASWTTAALGLGK